MKIVDFVEKLFRLSQVPIVVYDKEGRLFSKYLCGKMITQNLKKKA